jgi:hypothetical protein
LQKVDYFDTRGARPPNGVSHGSVLIDRCFLHTIHPCDVAAAAAAAAALCAIGLALVLALLVLRLMLLPL